MFNLFKGGMQVYVQLPNGKSIPFNCDLEDNFVVLKRKISERYPQIPYDQLLVIFEERSLEEQKPLKSYNIAAEARLKAMSVNDMILDYKKQLQQFVGSDIQQPSVMMQSSTRLSNVSQKTYKELQQELLSKENQILQLNQALNQKGIDQDEQIVLRLNKKIKQLEDTLNEEQENGRLYHEGLMKSQSQKKELDIKFQQSEQLRLKLDEGYNQQLQLKSRQIDELHREISELRKSRVEYENQIEKYVEDLQEKKYEIKLLEKDVQSFKDQIQAQKQKLMSSEKLPVMQSQTASEDSGSKLEIQGYKNQIDIAKAEIQELKNRLQSQKTKNDEQVKLNLQKDSQLNQLNDIIHANQQTIQSLNQEVENLNNQVISRSRENESLRGRLDNEIKQTRQTIEQYERQIGELNRIIVQLRQDHEDAVNRYEEKEKLANNLENKLTQEERDKEKIVEMKEETVSNLKREISKITDSNRQLQAMLDQCEMEKQNLKQSLDIEQRKNDRLGQDFDDLQKQWNESEQAYSKKLKNLQTRKDALANQLLQNKRRKKNFTLSGLVGPMEALFNSHLPFDQCLSSPNILTDQTEYSFQLIKIMEQKFEEKLSNISDLDFSQAVSIENVAKESTLKVTRTINPIAEGDNQQLFVFKVNEDPTYEYFSGKFFAIKQVIDVPKHTNPESAIRSAFPHLIAKFLLYKYLVTLKKNMKERIPNLHYGDIFLLEHRQEDATYYYVCEELFLGNFMKFNGGGKFNVGQNSEICNSFTFFSYQYTKQQLIVTNVQGVDLRLSDPSVSTEDGILGDDDLGFDELSASVSRFKELEPTVVGRKYLSAIGIKSL